MTAPAPAPAPAPAVTARGLLRLAGAVASILSDETRRVEAPSVRDQRRITWALRGEGGGGKALLGHRGTVGLRESYVERALMAHRST